MRLTELIISVLIMSLAILTVGYVFSSYNQAGQKSIQAIYSTNAQIKIDYQIRQIIRNVSFSYFENGNTQIQEAIKQINSIEGINIIQIDLLKDKNSFATGLKIIWSKNENSQFFETQDLFLSKGLIK